MLNSEILLHSDQRTWVIAVGGGIIGILLLLIICCCCCCCCCCRRRRKRKKYTTSMRVVSHQGGTVSQYNDNFVLLDWYNRYDWCRSQQIQFFHINRNAFSKSKILRYYAFQTVLSDTHTSYTVFANTILCCNFHECTFLQLCFVCIVRVWASWSS